jgi:hypothetical protein
MALCAQQHIESCSYIYHASQLLSCFNNYEQYSKSCTEFVEVESRSQKPEIDSCLVLITLVDTCCMLMLLVHRATAACRRTRICTSGDKLRVSQRTMQCPGLDVVTVVKGSGTILLQLCLRVIRGNNSSLPLLAVEVVLLLHRVVMLLFESSHVESTLPITMLLLRSSNQVRYLRLRVTAEGALLQMLSVGVTEPASMLLERAISCTLDICLAFARVCCDVVGRLQVAQK